MIAQKDKNTSCCSGDRSGCLALVKKISARESLLIGNLLLKSALPFCIFLIVLFGCVSIGAASSGWYDIDWSHRKAVTWTNVNATSLTNFAAYTNVSDEAAMQGDWDDVVFTDSVGNLIAYELENYTASYGEYWVNVTIPGSSSVSGWMYYGNAGTSSQENPEGVYDSYTKMVHHMQDLADSTCNNNDATNNGASYTSSGVVDGAYGYNGSSDYWDCGAGDSLCFADVLTIEAWVKPIMSQSGGLVTKGKYEGGYNFSYVADLTSQRLLYFAVYEETAVRFELVSTTPLSLDEWSYVVFTWSGDTTAARIYVDDNLDTENTDTGINSARIISEPVRIGMNKNVDYGDKYFNGTIDNVIISSTARSADWINQSYQLITNQSTFVSWGSVEEYDSWVPDVTGTINPNEVGATWVRWDWNHTNVSVYVDGVLQEDDYNLEFFILTDLNPNERHRIDVVNLSGDGGNGTRHYWESKTHRSDSQIFLIIGFVIGCLCLGLIISYMPVIAFLPATGLLIYLIENNFEGWLILFVAFLWLACLIYGVERLAKSFRSALRGVNRK